MKIKTLRPTLLQKLILLVCAGIIKKKTTFESILGASYIWDLV
jgi:hypothetical protein